MSDLVERLRDADYKNAASRCMEAADEIESLRRQLVKARNALQDAALQIHYMHTKFQTTGTGETALARIKAALIDENER